MASTEGPARAHDRHARRRPFANWMKRLANLKSLHTDSSGSVTLRRNHNQTASHTRKASVHKNNPYPLSHRIDTHANHLSFNTPLSSQRSRQSSVAPSSQSMSRGETQNKSRAPTLATTAETAISDVDTSGAGTIGTAAVTEGDRNSTFSSPAPSVRSMTTTLTTIQSIAPMQNNQNFTNNNYTQTTSNPTPTSAYYNTNNNNNNNNNPPASAVPAHLAPHSHPATYSSMTANNVLTDNASILTLASSSKRRRRNSVDTNASMKALAPASVFGGSRESLPLSVLSGTIIHPIPAGGDSASIRESTTGVGSITYQRSNFNAERASLISVSGITAPALASERNSYIGSKYAGDAASVRSGLLGTGPAGPTDRNRPDGAHTRTDSMTGSIGGLSRDARLDHRDRDRDRDRPEMVTAPTSPISEDSPIQPTTSVSSAHE